MGWLARRETQITTQGIGQQSWAEAENEGIAWMSEMRKTRRRWLQYRLRTLLILTVLCAIGLSGMSMKWRADRQRKLISRKLEDYGGDVRWDDAPWWSAKVKWADFSPYGYMKSWAPYKGEGITDDQLSELKHDLKHVEALFLGGTEVSDAGMVHLSEMTRLKVLDLGSTAITDSGLRDLAHHTDLEALLLGCTGSPDRELAWYARLGGRRALKTTYESQVTDDGLAHLSRLVKLKYLDLSETEITDTGLAHLERLSKLQGLSLQGTQVTDAGLTHLKKLTALQRLNLEHTQVTHGGIQELSQTLPACDIVD